MALSSEAELSLWADGWVLQHSHARMAVWKGRGAGGANAVAAPLVTPCRALTHNSHKMQLRHHQ
eukprot:358808-Chlamydomonas_euryale.AAC.6